MYQPAEDSFLLLHAARQEITPHDRVLEVGVGSGYVSSRLPPCAMVVATDINPHAAGIAKEAGVRIVRTDLAAGLCRVFDLILFNPPYLPTGPGERIDDWLEYALDGGPDGRDVIARFLQEIPAVLVPGGRVLLLISSLTGVLETREMIGLAGWDSSIAAQEMVEGGETLIVYRLKRQNHG